MTFRSRAIAASTSRSAKSARRLILVCGLVPAIIGAIVGLVRPDWSTRLDNAAYDIVLRSAGTRAPSGRVVIVDVDERSLATIGQWPWRRDVVARLVSGIRDRGPAAIALDIIFPEADRHDADATLAASLGEGGVLLGYAMTFDAAPRAVRECLLHPTSLTVLQPESQTLDAAADAPFFQATNTICSLPALARAAGASGFLNAAPDGDGILRRVPLVIEREGHLYPSLALAAVSGADAFRGPELHVANVNAGLLAVGRRRIPVDGRSNLLVRYRGPKGTFPYVSAADVLEGSIPGDVFRDKIVLVGTTALGTREVVSTPLDTLFTGVEVQATVADNLLQQDFIQRHAAGSTLEAIVALALAVGVALVVARTRMLWGGLAATGGIVGMWWGAGWLVAGPGIFVSPLFPTAGIVATFVVMTLAKSTLEGRRADVSGVEKTTAQQFMVQTLLSLTEVRDAETGRHSRRTQEYARLLAEELALHPGYRDYLTPARIELLSSLAPLHDIGKVGVPDHILNKPGALTPDELAEMRRHPVYGRDVILKAERQVGVPNDAILAMAKDIVYTHHERWDGTGYPEGLSGSAIPIPGRVMALVDVYDAAAARNVYRAPMAHDDLVGFIVARKGTHFDPAVVDAFLRVAPIFKNIPHDAGEPTAAAQT